MVKQNDLDRARQYLGGERSLRLENLDLSRADFANANLSLAKCNGGDFRRATFNRAILMGADFSAANLTGCTLAGAHIARVNFAAAIAVPPLPDPAETARNRSRRRSRRST